jgi:hypothetical protein
LQTFPLLGSLGGDLVEGRFSKIELLLVALRIRPSADVSISFLLFLPKGK